MFETGERDSLVIKTAMKRLIAVEALANLDYIVIVDLDNIEPLDKIKKEALIAVAVYFGKVRLIDNMIIRSKE